MADVTSDKIQIVTATRAKGNNPMYKTKIIVLLVVFHTQEIEFISDHFISRAKPS